jgi:hypothetical protein
MRIRPIALTVVSGVSVVITMPPQFLKSGKHFDLEFILSEPDRIKYRDLIEGTEVVTIMNGIGGAAYVLENNLADIFYSDLLRLGYIYRLRWSNNGAANTAGTTGLVGHFLNLNTPCCARRFNPANTVVPSVDA